VHLRGIRGGENVDFTSEIFNPKKYPLPGFADDRMFIPPISAAHPSCGPLCARICKCPQTVLLMITYFIVSPVVYLTLAQGLWDKFLNTPGEATYQCENRIQLQLNRPDNPVLNIQPALAEYLLRFIANSEKATTESDGFRHRDVTDLEGFTNFSNAIGLDEGYKNGEIWVAAVLGRFTIVLILYLDEVLPKVHITESSGTIRSRLSVHWSKVAMLLAVMTGLQVIFAVGAIWYCKGSVLIPDEISPLGGLVGHLQIPRSSTFTSMVSRSSFMRTKDSTVRAWFRLHKEGGVRRWILEFDRLGSDVLKLSEQRFIAKDDSEQREVPSEV